MDPRELFLSEQPSAAEVEEFLSGYGFKHPGQADDHLQQLVALVGFPERVAALAPLLLAEIGASVDPDAAVRNLVTVVESFPNRLNFLSLLESTPRVTEILIGILGASPFLAQLIVRNPEYFYWLLEKNRLQQVTDRAYILRQAEEVLRPVYDREAALNALRRLQRREILRIGAQDVLGLASMEETVSQVSGLAEGILESVLQLLMEDCPSQEGFSVIAMGKLGGAELNFSSDIDLIFLYADEEMRTPMLRLARNYLRALTEFTAEGHLYRVDLRLRPMGARGEIAYSEQACKQYYQTWADTTDRLSLIKSRFVAGDRRLGERFVHSLQDFIFKKYLDQAAVEEIRWIKERTDQQQRRRSSDDFNVKLGLGGIREIEFFVQSFQILYGGRHPELRTPHTLTGLARLVDAGFVGRDEFEELRSAYRFLRDLEHKLQLVHDLQTHSLPDEEEELGRCARRMGYRETDGEKALVRFREDLMRHKSNVRRIFESLFRRDRETGGFEEILLNPNFPTTEAVERLRAAGVEPAESVAEGLELLRDAPAFPYSPGRVRNLLANLAPRLVEVSRDLETPREFFVRLDRFCEALGSRANLYAELVENRDFSSRLLTLLALSPDRAEALRQNPELLESVTAPEQTEDYERHLREFLEISPQNAREALRRFKQREEFKIAVRELFNPGEPDHRQALSRLAEACLRAAFQRSMEEHPELDSDPFAFVALGKLAGSELTFHSDLDLIFVYDDARSNRKPADFSPFLKNLREELHEYTAQGRAYQVDFRLRPEGSHSTEAVSSSQLLSYFDARVEPWERLAYVKSRVVISQQEFLPSLHTLAFAQPFTDEERVELRHIRSRKEKEIGREAKGGHFDFKVGRGALLDIQFIIQYLQVKHQIYEPNILTAIEFMLEGNRISSAAAETLARAVRFLFSLESLNDLVGSKEARLQPGAWENRHLARLMGYGGEEELIAEYRRISDAVRELYKEILGEEANP